MAVVDMASLLEGEPSAFVDAVHYSSRGVLRFGELLADRLVESVPEPSGAYELTPASIERCSWDLAEGLPGVR